MKTKWRGWITIHSGDSGPVAGSPEFEFEVPGDATSFSIAEGELLRLWEAAGKPINMTPKYDPKDPNLSVYPNVKPSAEP